MVSLSSNSNVNGLLSPSTKTNSTTSETNMFVSTISTRKPILVYFPFASLALHMSSQRRSLSILLKGAFLSLAPLITDCLSWQLCPEILVERLRILVRMEREDREPALYSSRDFGLQS